MPYARQDDRLAAKRRYNASLKGRQTRRRYYLQHRSEQFRANPAPLAQAIKEWMQ